MNQRGFPDVLGANWFRIAVVRTRRYIFLVHKSDCVAVAGKREILTKLIDSYVAYHGSEPPLRCDILVKARAAVLSAMREIDTYASQKGQLDHLMEVMPLMWLSPTDSGHFIPSYMLRLSRDQECYYFIIWWNIEPPCSPPNWKGPWLRYRETAGADPLEPIECLPLRSNQVAQSIPLVLLKIRIRQDLMALKETFAVVGRRLPSELSDMIMQMVIQFPIVAESMKFLEHQDLTKLIDQVDLQIAELYNEVKEMNPYFWQILANKERYAEVEIKQYERGSEEAGHVLVQETYAGWAETPGALDVIRKRLNN